MTSYRRILAAAALATLIIPFQNCGSKQDLGSYVNNSSTAVTPVVAPKIPEIVSVSTPVTVDALSSTALSVVAKGEEPLTYQWYKDGAAVDGQTKPLIAIVEPLPNPVSASSSISTYKVVVKDANNDTVTSSDIPVTVQKTAAQLAGAPAITGFTLAGNASTGSQRPTCGGNANQGNLPIAVVASGIRLKYSWKITYARGNNTNYTDNLSTTTASLTPPLIPVFDPTTGVLVCRVMYFGTYNVTVTDAFGRTTTGDYVVTSNTF